MIYANDLVRMITRLPEDPRSKDIGIVLHVSGSPGDETVTVLWPAVGTEERWSITGLEAFHE